MPCIPKYLDTHTDQSDLPHDLGDDSPWHDRMTGKMPLEKILILPDRVPSYYLVRRSLIDAIDKQERPGIRQGFQYVVILFQRILYEMFTTIYVDQTAIDPACFW